MKSRIFKTLPLAFIVAGSIAFVSCKDGKTTENDVTAEETLDMDMMTAEDDASHLAAWAGSYEGTLPCADCEGIETSVVLNSDGTYEKTDKYLKGTEGSQFQEMGTYTLDSNTNVITLKPANEDTTSGAFLFKFENDKIVALDREGNKVTGELADHYVLKKQ